MSSEPMADAPVPRSEPIPHSYRVRDTTFYGAPLGILTIDSSEPFIPGDVGNASTFPFPVRYRRVEGCTIDRLVVQADESLAEPVIAAAQQLVVEGARAITSNCGFMLRMQAAVAEALDVPVLLSGLLQLPLVASSLAAGRSIGVVTASAESLDAETLALSGVSVDRLVVAGMEHSPSFRSAFLEESGSIEPEKVAQEVEAVTRQLVVEHDPGAIVVECAALPPYAHVMQSAAPSVPVFDAVTLINAWYAALFREAYHGHY
jgi:Asp/Glu/hydantoin racemase